MIEFTTSVLLLFSNLYGSASLANVATPVEAAVIDQKTITIESNTGLTDLAVNEHSAGIPLSMENEVRKYYADTPILIDVARCESRFRQYMPSGKVVRGEANPDDVGIMQINEFYHLETAKKLGFDIYKPEGNLAYGKWLYEHYGSDPWVHSSKCWNKNPLNAAVRVAN